MKEKIILSLVIVIAIGGTIWFWKSQRFTSNTNNKAQQEELAQAINGNMVSKEIASRRPIAVSIENHPDARPQSGLTDADIVYESLTEGGITRFLAIFQTREVKEIGPIRSTRTFFNYIANEWSAVLAHAGGNSDALEELKTKKYKNLSDADQFFNDKSFTREKSRTAPHNLYTTDKLLRELISNKGYESWTPMTLWEFATIPTNELKMEVTQITIPFSDSSYLVNYKFDPNIDSYTRSIGSKQIIDKNNSLQVSPKNVLIQFADNYPTETDTVGSQDFSLNTKGPVLLFTGGKVVAGRWESINGKTKYTTNDGKSLVLQPGQTFVEIFPRSRQNEIKWQ